MPESSLEVPLHQPFVVQIPITKWYTTDYIIFVFLVIYVLVNIMVFSIIY